MLWDSRSSISAMSSSRALALSEVERDQDVALSVEDLVSLDGGNG